MIKEALPLLKKSKQANICMISSLAGDDPWEKHGVYGISKAGVNNMTKFLSKELQEDNIRVNSVVPGTVDTQMA